MGAAGQRCGRLQEPEEHMGAHMEGTAGQREASVEEPDCRIWNQIQKQTIRTYLRRVRPAACFRADTAEENRCVLGVCALQLACFLAFSLPASSGLPLCNTLTDPSSVT